MNVFIYNENMFKSYIPFAHASSIYDIDLSFYKKHGITTIFADLDNTLDSYRSYAPNEKTIEFLKNLNNEGLKLVIISNNRGNRVSTYSKKLGVDFISSARKPFPFKIRKEIKIRNLKNDEVILIGDQLMTDVIAGKRAGIKVILTEKIVKEDQWTTRFNRIFDRPIRKYLNKKQKLIDWRNL